MASLTDLYYSHMAKQEQVNPELDYFTETKSFLQGLADQHTGGKQISDQAASQFLASALPDQQASGLRVFGNFLARMYPNLVEGSIKTFGELVGNVGNTQQDFDPMYNGYDYITKKLSQQGMDPVEEPTEQNSLQKFGIAAVRDADKIADQLVPDFARERATSTAGGLAEVFGESIVKDIPILMATHQPSALVGDAVAGVASRVAPKLFGKTVQQVTTTFGPEGVTKAVTSIAGQEGVRTLTQKILHSAVYDIAYGVPQGIGLTAANKDVYLAGAALRTETDPVKREALKDTITTRIGEDQFFNIVVGMGLAPIIGGASRLLPDYAARKNAIREVIQTVSSEGKAPIPVSDKIGGMLQQLPGITDPVERQAMIRQIEFTHADEASDQITEWVKYTKDVLKDDFSVSRKTGSVLTSWRDQLDTQIQTLNGLIEESGAAPVEAHIQIMEKLSDTATLLDDLYESSGMKRIDTLLQAPEQELSEADVLLRRIFEKVDSARAADNPTENVFDTPPAIHWLKSLNQGTILSAVQVTPQKNAEHLRDLAVKEIIGKFSPQTDVDYFNAVKKSFFNPEAPLDRMAILTTILKDAHKIVRELRVGGDMATNVPKFMKWLDGAFDRQYKAGKFTGLELFESAREFTGHPRDTNTLWQEIFGVPTKINVNNGPGFSKDVIQTLPGDIVQKAFKVAKDTANGMFYPELAKAATLSLDVLESFYGRFRQELSNAMGLPSVTKASRSNGFYQPWNHIIALSEKSHWTVSIHEMAHHFEMLLPSDVTLAFNQYFNFKKNLSDTTAIGAALDRDGNIHALTADRFKDPYWGSFTEAFARYFQNILGYGIGKSPDNILQMSKENLMAMRAAVASWADVSQTFYGGREHALLAREIFGLIVDDLDATMLKMDKKMSKMSLDIQTALEDRVPEIFKKHTAEVEARIEQDIARNLSLPFSKDSNPVTQMKAILAEVDKTLNITHENKTMEQLVKRFFHLQDLFSQHITRTPELESFYKNVVFTGNNKLIEDLRAGFSNTKLIEGVLDAAADPRALHTSYESFKNFVMQADEILSGAYQHSPQVWITNDTKAFTSSLDRVVKDVLRKIPFYRDREGLTIGISRLSRLTDQAEFLIKKMPLLKPVYGAWERHMQDSRKFLNEVFEGTHKGLPLRDGKPIQEYLALPKDDPRLKVVDELLLWSNEVSNDLAAKTPPEMLDPIDEFGKIPKEIARAKYSHLSDEVFDDIYKHYTGVRHTLSFILGDMRSLAKHKQLLSDSELLKITQKHGQLRGYIPQTRKGKFMLATTRELVGDNGNIVKEPVLIFSDDLAHLRKLQQTEYPNAQVGRVQKKFDAGHFSTNAAAIDKLLSTVAEKKGIDDDVMDMIRTEISNHLKSGSFLSHTIKRRNVAGWDTTRVREGIYEYMQNYSRFRHKHDAMQESLQALSYLTDRKYTEGWKWAQNLIHDMNTTTDSYKPLEFARNMVIFKMLGYNVSSALMQLTQNGVMALPRMVLEGIPRSGRELLKAFNDVRLARPLGEYEQRAMREGHLIGVTYANNINALMGNVRSNGVTSDIGRKVLENSMFMMRKMEELNRQSTLLAAYRGIREQLLKAIPEGGQRDLESIHMQALERAVTITKDAHLTYDKINRPEVLRGGNLLAQTGRQFYLLKQFSHGYFQLFSYMLRNGSTGQKAATKSLLALATLGGFTALPGYEQLSEGFRQLTGKDANEPLEELAGFGGRVLGHGMSAFLPAPLGRRLNPMPSSVGNLVAPPGMSLLEGMDEARKAYNNGDYVRMFWNSPFVPTAVGNIAKSVERHIVGHTTRSGKPIKDTRHSTAEMLSGIVGLTPENAEYLKYMRATYKERRDTEKRQELYSRIRREGQRGKLSVETRKAFYDEQRRMLRNGQRMSYKTPYDLLRQVEE